MKNIIIIISLFLMSCNNSNTVNEENKKESTKVEDNVLVLSDEQLKQFPIETGKLEKKELSGKLQLNGKVAVHPDQLVSLSSALGGYVKSVPVLPGKVVKKGEVVLVLEDNQFIQIQQDYITTKAQLLSAEPNYRRQLELNANKSASDKVMQLAETEYRTLLAAKGALEEKLRLININPALLTYQNIKRSIPVVAPFNSIVSKVLVNKGKYVSPSDILVELINPNGLLLNIKVFEKDWSKISVGQELTASSNEDVNSVLKAKIISKGNMIGEDGSTEVIAKITQNNGINLTAGLFVNVFLELKKYESYTLPEEAIISFEGKNYIFENKTKNEFAMQEVKLGSSSDGLSEILNPDALINKNLVKKGAYTLLMALKNKSEE